jgi:hypothetical protein
MIFTACVALAGGSHAFAQTLAEQYQDDYRIDRYPSVGTSLSRLLALVGCNEEFAWTGAGSPPFGAPPGATSIFVAKWCHRSTWNATCLEICSRTEVTRSVVINFSDGSSYVYRYSFSDKACYDGVTYERTTSRDTTDSAKMAGADTYRIRGETVTRQQQSQNPPGRGRSAPLTEETTESRFARWNAPSGGTLAPVGSGDAYVRGVDDLELRAGPGGTVDLTAYSASSPLVSTPPNSVTIYADTVDLAPTVTLEDVFGVTPEVLPGETLSQAGCLIVKGPCEVGPGINTVKMKFYNDGNDTDTINVDWIDDLGWVAAGIVDVSLDPGESDEVSIDIDIPLTADVCDVTQLTIETEPTTGPATVKELPIYADDDADGDGIENSCDFCFDLFEEEVVDTDGDGFPDLCDNCPEDFNPDQDDINNDGIGEACQSIPTVSEWGVAIMTLILLSAGTMVVFRRQGEVAGP